MNELKRTIGSQLIIIILILTTIVLAIVASVLSTSAWFASNDKVEANGMLISANSPVSILIKQNKNGNDVGVIEIDENTVHIDNYIDDDETTIQPGSSGHFNFCVEYDDTKHNDTYPFTLSIKVVNNYYHDEYHGFFVNKQEKLDDQRDSLLYINSHLFFFKNYDSETGIYSNWIRSEEEFILECVEDEENYVGEVTIYWIWIQDYSDLFGSSCDYVNTSDISSISAYYSLEENKTKMFSEGYISDDAYNVADYVIGTTLQYICFEIDVK